MREFLDLNALAHETIYNTMLATGTIITHYPLWAPLGIDDDFLSTHNAEHKEIANVLGLPLPPDLDQVDIQDQVSASDWFENHALLHSLIAAALGI